MTGDVKVDLDEVLMVTGYKGKYQIIQGIFLLLVSLSCAYPILFVVFIGYIPEHRCAQLPNGTNLSDFGVSEDEVVDIIYNQCSIGIKSNNSGVTTLTNIKCINGYDYFDAHKDISIVSEWDLVCGRAGLAELSQTLLMLGQGVGAVVFTSLADKYGRQPIHLIAQGGLLCACIAIVFINNIGGFLVLRFIVGAMQQAVGLTRYSIFVEMFVTRLRSLAGTLAGLAWTTAVMSLAPLGYLLQHYSWRYFQIATVIAMSYAVLQIWITDESLRWLVANNQIGKAEKLIKRICVTNKSEFSKSKLVLYKQLARAKTSKQETLVQKLMPVNELQQLQTDSGSEKPEKLNLNDIDKEEEVQPLILTTPNNQNLIHNTLNNQNIESNVKENGPEPDVITTKQSEKKNKKIEKSPDQYNVFDLFRYFDILKVTMILCYIWTINNLTYYGLFLTSSSLSGNRFLNFFLNAAVELPAMFLVFYALKRLDRRSVCGLSMIISGVALIISVTLVATVGHTSVGSTSSVVFSLIGKLAITVSYNGLFIYTPELFPTNMRSAGLGVAASIAKVGGMIAPFSSLLSDVVIWGPGVVFGCGCLIAAMLITLLPETRGRPLPTTIEEMRAWKHIQTSTIELSIK